MAVFNDLNVSTQNSLIIKGDIREKDFLKSQINSHLLVDRNIYIQKVVKFLSIDPKQQRLLHVFGNEANGKGDIVNFACKHALDGRVPRIKAGFYLDLSEFIHFNKDEFENLMF